MSINKLKTLATVVAALGAVWAAPAFAGKTLDAVKAAELPQAREQSAKLARRKALPDEEIALSGRLLGGTVKARPALSGEIPGAMPDLRQVSLGGATDASAQTASTSSAAHAGAARLWLPGTIAPSNSESSFRSVIAAAGAGGFSAVDSGRAAARAFSYSHSCSAKRSGREGTACCAGATSPAAPPAPQCAWARANLRAMSGDCTAHAAAVLPHARAASP